MAIQRLPAMVLIAAYLTAIAWYFVRHVEGDPGRTAFAYFWTWDMFPHYESESVRRIVVGRTRGGEYVQLLPSGRDRFRWGNNDDATRYDLDRRNVHLEAAVSRAVARYDAAGTREPLLAVLVIDRYWPARFNLAEAHYRKAYDESNPRRQSFRIAAEAEVTDAGTVKWREP